MLNDFSANFKVFTIFFKIIYFVNFNGVTKLTNSIFEHLEKSQMQLIIDLMLS